MIYFVVETSYYLCCDQCNQRWTIAGEAKSQSFPYGVSCPNCGHRSAPQHTSNDRVLGKDDPIRTLKETSLGSSLIDVRECASLLNCSAEHLMRLARAGDIPAAKIGRSWVFFKEDLMEWLRKPGLVKAVLAPRKRGRPRNELPRL